MNIWVGCGRLTKKPEIKYFTDSSGEQKPVATYTLAVDRRKKGEADFINCKAFGKLADFASNYLDKGTKLIVRGEIRTGNYTNKEGKKVYYTECQVDSQEFAESKSANTGSNIYPSDDLPPVGGGEMPSDMPAASAAPDSFMNIPSDINTDLPFRS